ncbi:unnamed protein product, partial [Phaeothamnion confervicola]
MVSIRGRMRSADAASRALVAAIGVRPAEADAAIGSVWTPRDGRKVMTAGSGDRQKSAIHSRHEGSPLSSAGRRRHRGNSSLSMDPDTFARRRGDGGGGGGGGTFGSDDWAAAGFSRPGSAYFSCTFPGSAVDGVGS